MALGLLRDLQNEIANLKTRVRNIETLTTQQGINMVVHEHHDANEVECIDGVGGTLTVGYLVATHSTNGLDDNSGKPIVVLAGQNISEGEVFGVVTKSSAQSMTQIRIIGIGCALYDEAGGGSIAFDDIKFGDRCFASSNDNGKIIVGGVHQGNAGIAIQGFTVLTVKYVVFIIGKGGVGDTYTDEITVTQDSEGVIALFGYASLGDIPSLAYYGKLETGSMGFGFPGPDNKLPNPTGADWYVMTTENNLWTKNWGRLHG